MCLTRHSGNFTTTGCNSADTPGHYCVYNVYSLSDGLVDDELSFCDIETADAYAETLSDKYRKFQAENPDNGAEIFVTIYDTFCNEIFSSCTLV